MLSSVAGPTPTGMSSRPKWSSTLAAMSALADVSPPLTSTYLMSTVGSERRKARPQKSSEKEPESVST